MEISFDNLPQAIAMLSKKMDLVLHHLQKTESKKEEDEIMNIKQAALFLDSTVGTLYQDKRIPRFKKMGKLYFLKSQLKAWVLEDGNVRKEPKLQLTRSRKAS